MTRPRVSAGGGLAAILYVLKKGWEARSIFRLYGRLRSRNACKTCALGMGGQKGGMVNEVGHFPEVCKKSVQAQAGDMGKVVTEEFFQQAPIEALKRYSSRELEALGRLPFPILAGPQDRFFRRLTWEEALDHCGKALKIARPERVFFYSSGRSSNEAAFLFQLVARAYGTPHIHNCSYYCHQASGVALSKIYGSGTSSIVLEDLEKADLVLLAGANPASNHPRLITQLIQLRRRGGKVIVVNPLKELGLVRFRLPSDWRSFLFGSDVSDLYLQPHVGSDVALFQALLKGVMEKGAMDHDFIDRHTAGWTDLATHCRDLRMEDLLTACGVSRAELDQSVEMLTKAKRGIFLWAMGLTHHQNGVENVLALGNLALARGWLGRPGCGLLPIRGHSNVQGVGSCGVAPQVKKVFAQKLEEIYGIQVPAGPGQDTYASMVAAERGQIDAAILLGGNLFSSNPDRPWAGRSLNRIPFTFYMSTKLNERHLWGRGQTTVIVPVLARDEESQGTTQESMFNFVRLSEGGSPNVNGEMRSEVEIIASIAERILPYKGFPWESLRSHQRLREEMAKVVTGYEKIAAIARTGTEFQIGGRTFHEPRFATPDGKAHFHVVAMPAFKPQRDEFRLMTLRSEGQFNTVVYDEEDLYRGNVTRDVVMMGREDAKRLSLQEGERVWVKTAAGQMQVKVSILDLPPGNLAMYYPEANALVPQRLDPLSKTPAFKSIIAKIER